MGKHLPCLKVLCVSLLVVFLTLFISGRISASASSPRGAVSGFFIIKLAPGVRLSDITSAAAASGGQAGRMTALQVPSSLPHPLQIDRYLVYRTKDTTMTAARLKRQLGSSRISYIEPEYYLDFFELPKDSLFSQQWYLQNTGQWYFGINRIAGDFNDSLLLKRGTAGIDNGLTPLYQTPSPETTKVVVAIVDSGTDLFHPELRNQLWHNEDEIPGNGADDDHNGFIDDTLGYDVSGDVFDFFDPVGDNDPTDIVGHGTHVAGIVAAEENGFGVVGIAPDAEIMPVKIRPNATTAVGAAGIMYAVVAGADVINLSWGTQFESLVLKDAIDFARANGVFVCASSGNSGDNQRFFPAAFDSVFTVGASDSRGFVTSFSTYGAHVDIVAPGLDILSLRAAGTDMFAQANEPGVRIIGDDSLYYLSDGTSMSCPMVAGAAALIKSMRPDLSVADIESILRHGATDIIDPFDDGSSYPGPDSLSGWGRLNVANALSFASTGGLHIMSPRPRERYTGPLAVQIAPTAAYIGGWQLYFKVGDANSDWTFLAEGNSVPTDSTVYTFDPDTNGVVTLKLVDDSGHEQLTQFIYVRKDRIEITSPQPGEERDFFVPLRGNAFGPSFDSLEVRIVDGGINDLIFSNTGEFFDSLIFTWDASGIAPGPYTLILTGFYDGFELTDSVSFLLKSAFATGWPQALPGRGALSPAVGDIDGDGKNELVVGTAFGLQAYHSNGEPVAGFPVLTDQDVRTIPAIYDIDRDGENEIVCISQLGAFAFNGDGSLVQGHPGWPQFSNINGFLIELIAGGFGLPNPSILQLHQVEDSAIVYIDNRDHVLAYRFDGQSYFYSLEGFYAALNPSNTEPFFWSNSSVMSADLDGNGTQEVVMTYSSLQPTAGVGVFDGRTGEPAFGRAEPHIIKAQVVYGSVMADLNRDNLMEIITSGYDSTGTRTLWVKTRGQDDLPGWPRQLPEMDGWLGSVPMVGDLDLDGIPEILTTYFEFDRSVLYIFRADGSPYVSRDGRPPGDVYHPNVILGIPVVANLTGDNYPEIVMRSGFIIPGTGFEQVHILDHQGNLLPGWPTVTPAPPRQVFSTVFTPLVDDLDNDGLVELILISEAGELLVWDFDAPSDNGRNHGRLLMDNRNSSMYISPGVPTDVGEDNPLLPTRYDLSQNYPNPFNPSTNIQFDIPTIRRVQLEVYNVLGQKVQTLIDRQLTPGRYTIPFDGSRLASGVYLYRLRAGDVTLSKKMTLLK